mgnify:CR=1 FL=1
MFVLFVLLVLLVLQYRDNISMRRRSKQVSEHVVKPLWELDP